MAIQTLSLTPVILMICESPPETLCDRQFLWISTSPSLQCFHRRILGVLDQEFPLKYWEYSQTPDEPGSLAAALSLLHEFVQTSDRPLHIIGHGLGGVLALNYARCYPGRVASVVLISVAAQPSITWQTYYYQQLSNICCRRDAVLQLVAGWVSGITCPHYVRHLAERLDRDLLEAPSATSLLKKDTPFGQGTIVQPLLVCGAIDDPVLMGGIFSEWLHYLKNGDQFWHQPTGGHFFHHQHAETLGLKVRDFWRQITPQSLPCLLPQPLEARR
jgi:pimeloyl-ACP methyl ester carboxylesterase